jgi:hypothetical protein
MKKTILLVSGAGSVMLVSLLFLLLNNSSSAYWDFGKSIYDSTFYFLFPLLCVFPFSIITYKMREEVFRAWWKYATWYVPFLIVLTLVIEWMPKSGGGWAGLYSELPYQIVQFFYGIFFLVSLLKIFFAWRSTKNI